MQLQYKKRKLDTAYVTNNLLVPKEAVPLQAIKNSLEFLIGKEPIIDDVTQEVIGEAPHVLRLWNETDTHLIIPRSFIAPSNYDKYPFPFVVEEPTFETVNIESRAQPRGDVQRLALDAMLRERSGTLNLSCGIGKTVIGLMLAAILKVPTIIVVNSKNLIAQWKEEILDHLNVKSIGIMRGSQADWQKNNMVIATIQTLAAHRDKLPMSFRRKFGLALYDEGHHMSAPVFAKGADLFFGRRYALTATARRTDGLEAIYQYHLGKVIFKDLTQNLIPRTTFHVLDWILPQEDRPRIRDVNNMVNMSRLQGYLGSLDWRNEIIKRYIREDLKNGRDILVLSHSVDHVASLAASFGEDNAITGKVDKPDDRLRILRSKNPVFGTFHLSREALNKKTLDTLYITTPFGNSNDLQQAWGRIQREYKGKKEPKVRIFEDKQLRSCARACGHLRKYLKVLQYPFTRKKEGTR